jgi:multiple sugar transport system permease protein
MAVKELDYRPTGVHVPRRMVAMNVVYYVLLSIAAVAFFFPFFWTVMTSLKRPSEILLFPPTVFPEIPQWHNYARVFEKVPFVHWTGSTLFIVFANTTGMLLSASLAAYGFARFDFKIKEVLFIITLGTMMMPAQVTLIPQFVLFHKLNWIDTFRPLWVPAWFGGGAFAIFLMRQFMMTLPRDLDEAAIIDGASYVRIFWNILVSGGQPLQHLLMAASVMSTAPLIILFFSAQQYFVQGIALTGIKG